MIHFSALAAGHCRGAAPAWPAAAITGAMRGGRVALASVITMRITVNVEVDPSEVPAATELLALLRLAIAAVAPLQPWQRPIRPIGQTSASHVAVAKEGMPLPTQHLPVSRRQLTDHVTLSQAAGGSSAGPSRGVSPAVSAPGGTATAGPSPTPGMQHASSAPTMASVAPPPAPPSAAAAPAPPTPVGAGMPDGGSAPAAPGPLAMTFTPGTAPRQQMHALITQSEFTEHPEPASGRGGRVGVTWRSSWHLMDCLCCPSRRPLQHSTCGGADACAAAHPSTSRRFPFVLLPILQLAQQLEALMSDPALGGPAEMFPQFVEVGGRLSFGGTG